MRCVVILNVGSFLTDYYPISPALVLQLARAMDANPALRVTYAGLDRSVFDRAG